MMMNRALLFVAILAILCGCTVDSRKVIQLAYVDSLNKSGYTFTTDTLIRPVAEYFAHHGSANQRMKAYYLLGRAYSDMGEAPKALECFHNAADCADTTDADCDFRTLNRVYGQMADMFYYQNMPGYQLQALKNAQKAAWKDNDTLSALIYFQSQADAYEYMGKTDSVFLIGKEAYHKLKEFGADDIAAQSLATLIYACEKEGNYSLAKRYIEEYDNKSNRFDAEGNIEKGAEIFYYMKGKYYLANRQLDSAAYYFRKELAAAADFNNLHAATLGLTQLYQAEGEKDSTAKYALLTVNFNDSLTASTNTASLQRIQAMFDYSRQKQHADKMAYKAERLQKHVWILLTLLMVLLLASYALFSRIRRQKREQIEYMKRRYEVDIATLEQAKTELSLMLSQQEASFDETISEKQEQIHQLKRQIAQNISQRKRTSRRIVDEKLFASPAYQLFKRYADIPLSRPQLSEWADLRALFSRELPLFYQTLVIEHNLKISDYDVCLLLRLQFRTTEIANLTGWKAPTITTKRHRLYKRIFGKEEKGDEFVTFLMEIL